MEKFRNLMRDFKSHTNTGNTESPKHRKPERPTARHIIINIAKFQDREDLKGSKGETGSNIQGGPNKTTS